MENLLKIIIILLLLLLILLFVAIASFAIYFYRKRVTDLGPTSTKVDGFNCKNHSQIPSTGSCAICNSLFCDICLKEHDKLNFCPDHYNLFLQNEWKELITVKTTPDEPEKAMCLYHLKDRKWHEDQLPTYIVTHYKINISNDHIESHVKLFAKPSDFEELKKELEC